MSSSSSVWPVIWCAVYDDQDPLNVLKTGGARLWSLGTTCTDIFLYSIDAIHYFMITESHIFYSVTREGVRTYDDVKFLRLATF